MPASDYTANAYIGCSHACKYCYASFMKRFTNHPEPWGEFVDVKYWDSIKNIKKFEDKEIFLSSVCDPYQAAEKQYKRTRKLLEELRGSNAKITIGTKSSLVLRDIDLIKEFKNIRVSFSINTLNENFKNDMDKASSIADRLNALKILHGEKIPTVCFISPIFPGISEVKEIIAELKDYCNYIWLENLNLRGNYKAVILKYIRDKYPNLIELYDYIYNKNNKNYWKNMDLDLQEYAKNLGLEYTINEDKNRTFTEKALIVNYFYHEEIRKNAK